MSHVRRWLDDVARIAFVYLFVKYFHAIVIEAAEEKVWTLLQRVNAEKLREEIVAVVSRGRGHRQGLTVDLRLGLTIFVVVREKDGFSAPSRSGTHHHRVVRADRLRCGVGWLWWRVTGFTRASDTTRRFDINAAMIVRRLDSLADVRVPIVLYFIVCSARKPPSY